MERCRARDLGIEIGIFDAGPRGAITDVDGVLVGHATIVEGEGRLVPGRGPVRTGVTVVLPHAGNLFLQKAQAGYHVLNGFGKSAGLHQIRELGVLETPIALTNTLNVPLVADALVEWSCGQASEIGIRTGTVNPVVGDVNDGYLNDIQGRHVRAVHLRGAIASAVNSGPGAPVREGSVGGGTGCSCLGFKGGIGTSSRVLPARLGGWTVGALVQTNFGGILSVNGTPVGRELGVYDFAPADGGSSTKAEDPGAAGPLGPAGDSGAEDGSCMIVIGTDAPLEGRQLGRVARRCGLGLARTGFYSANGSGDFFIAFSTAQNVPHAGDPIRPVVRVADDALSAVFAATVEAVEEAVINSLTAADTMVGRDGNAREGLPLGDLERILDRYSARNWSSRLPPFGRI